MKLLTDRCREDFEKWFEDKWKINPNKEPSVFHPSFKDMDLSFQFGILQDFFDEKSVYIDIETEYEYSRSVSDDFEINYHYVPEIWYFKIHDNRECLSRGIFSTRQEARKESIIKANSIYNER